jgi:hypothetical protein
MEMPTWLISVIGGVSGAVVTLVTTLIVNRVSYKHEYYKMIIEKRIKAYNNVERLLYLIKSESLKSMSKIHVLKDENTLKSLEQEIKNVKDDSVWLTETMKMAVSSFIKSVYLFEEKPIESLTADDALGLYTEIKAMALVIEDVLVEDLKSLHKVRCFLRNKRVIKE